MRIGITSKMILVLLATSTLLVGAMAVAMRWSFQKGFHEYLTDAELGGLDQTAQDLANAYRREGSWDFLRGDHTGWMTFLPIDPATRFAPERMPPPPEGLARGSAPRRPGGVAPPPAPGDRSGLSTRLRLLDAQRRRVIGPPDTSGKPHLRSIDLDGEVVGWLSLTPQAVPASNLDRSFRDEQLGAIYPIAAGGLLMALLVGIPLGRHLLRPVKTVAQGAHALASGDYETRLPIESGDELGGLAVDFNTLADVLQRNERLRRQGMADISHELRTPLALMRAEIEAMQDGIRPRDEAQLGKLHGANTQLSRLVDDLYELALADAGALSYQKQPIDLAELLRNAASAAEIGLNQQGLRLERAIPPSLPMVGDGPRLRQVFDNLLKNSRRYTDAGGVVALAARREAGEIVVDIADSAPGVDDATLARLFDRFYRAEGSRNRATGGAGLGLAICRNIVEAHQGGITAAHAEQGGLRVTITLPSA